MICAYRMIKIKILTILWSGISLYTKFSIFLTSSLRLLQLSNMTPREMEKFQILVCTAAAKAQKTQLRIMFY